MNKIKIPYFKKLKNILSVLKINKMLNNFIKLIIIAMAKFKVKSALKIHNRKLRKFIICYIKKISTIVANQEMLISFS
jgi:hypothetical protein